VFSQTNTSVTYFDAQPQYFTLDIINFNCSSQKAPPSNYSTPREAFLAKKTLSSLVMTFISWISVLLWSLIRDLWQSGSNLRVDKVIYYTLDIINLHCSSQKALPNNYSTPRETFLAKKTLSSLVMTFVSWISVLLWSIIRDLWQSGSNLWVDKVIYFYIFFNLDYILKFWTLFCSINLFE
jgi:predicted transcriptional regulator